MPILVGDKKFQDNVLEGFKRYLEEPPYFLEFYNIVNKMKAICNTSPNIGLFTESLMLKPLGILGILKLAKQKEKIKD